MRRGLILLFIKMAAAITLNAQKSEYAVLNSGDTIKGSVEIESLHKVINAIQVNEGTKNQLLKPTDVLSFYDSKYGYYASKLIVADNFFMGNDVLPKDGKMQAFVKVLIQGKISLYSYKEDSFYFFESEGSIELLRIETKKVFVGPDRSEKLLKDNVYKRQLLLAMNKDCPTIYNTIEHTQLNEQSLIKLFERYSECAKHQFKDLTKVQDKPKRQFNYGIISGGSSMKMSIINNSVGPSQGVTLAKFETDNNFVAGLYYTLFISRYNPRLSINIESLFRPISVTTGIFESSSAGFAFSYSIDSKVIKTNAILKYPLMVESKFRPEIMLGLSSGLLINSKSYRTVYNDFTNSVREEDLKDDLRKIELGYLAGVGINYLNKFGLNIRYELTNGLLHESSSYRAPAQTIYVCAWYNLKRN